MPLSTGLSIPVLTALDSQGRLDEASQLRLLDWVRQDGAGAEILFSGGTTGEWNRIEAPQLRRLNALCIEACQASVLWAGITSSSLSDTLANLEEAHRLKASAVVLAPLSIVDAPAPVELFENHIDPLFKRLGSSLPICLYDNADIAVRVGEDHIRTRDVKALSQLDYVFGIKVSASASVIGNYLKGARHFNTAHEFGIYLGNANLSFSKFPRGEKPLGVVAGPANLFPREWRRAWQACENGETGLMKAYQACFESLGKAWQSKALACMKLALAEEGIIADPTVAPGTPALNAEEKRLWMADYRRIKNEIATFSPQGWISEKRGNYAARI